MESKFAPLNWNISRMECKAHFWAGSNWGKQIGIYPEWNVKEVEVELEEELNILEYIQNGM